MPKFRKKPVVIDALEWNGNWAAAKEFCPELIDGGQAEFDTGAISWPVFIKTREGTMTAAIGDWIIKGVAGEFYPCKNEIFIQTYEPVE